VPLNWGCILSKCPKCEQVFSHVSLNAVNVNAIGAAWNGVSYDCPYCQTSLGVSIDPIAIKTDIVADLLKALRGQ
jgi:hypothetical protein